MNINIAFNTIIYIMVFLFPGLIFRRSFFSGKFGKHFDSGNIFERVLWYIFISIGCIICFSLANELTDGIFMTSLGVTLSKSEILSSFETLYNNEFPKILKHPSCVTEIIYTLVSLYIFSFLLALSLNRIIFIFGLEKKMSIFRFQSDWDYLTISNKENNSEHSIGDVFFTQVDVKLEDDQLYTGRFHDVILNKEKSEIHSIILSDTYKFYKIEKNESNKNKIKEIKKEVKNGKTFKIFHYENKNEYHFKKRIKGNLFIIPNEKIENLSFTYIKVYTLKEEWEQFLLIFKTLFVLFIIIFSFAYAVWDFEVINFSSYYKRLAFCIMLPINTIFSILLISSILSVFKKKDDDRNIYIKSLKASIVSTVIGAIPYLYIFDVVSFYNMIFGSIVFIFLLRKIYIKIRKVFNKN